MNQLQECHKLVWDFRREIKDYWATPNPLDSLRYSFTEAAEAMDAWLRAERPSDSRNNERENDVLDELADTAIMLLTALNFDEIKNQTNGRYDTEFVFLHAIKPERHRLEVLSSRVANAALSASDDFYETSSVYLGWIHDTVMSLGWIASYPEMELKQRIQARLARIAFKHMPLFKSAELIEKLQLPANNLPYDSVNHPLVNE
jgi:NTP pyrophosphatase (non-canonical NTP hydrolase)